MTINAVRLAAGEGTGSPVTVVTAGPNTTVVIKRATVNNTTGVAITYSASANSGSARELITDRPVATSKSDQPPELVGLTLNAGDTLTLDLPVGVTYWISGITIVG